MKKILFLILLSVLTNCNQKKSENILDKETYKNVLKEIIFVNILQQEIQQNDSLKKNLLGLVYQKYHIDSIQFNRTTDYYGKHPEQLAKIYDEIYLEIKKVSDSLEELSPKKPKTDKIKIPVKGFDKKIDKLLNRKKTLR